MPTHPVSRQVSPYVQELQAHEAALRQDLGALGLPGYVLDQMLPKRAQLTSIFQRYGRAMLASYDAHVTAAFEAHRQKRDTDGHETT